MSQQEFDLLEEAIQPYLVGGRSKTVALLAWFLENVWRMEPEDVEDAICDGGGDKGIDALEVDDDIKEITIFQSKHRQNAARTQGDADLQRLVGAAPYFETPGAVDGLLASGPNPDLTRLLLRLEIRQKVADGAHAARLVFVTNGELDVSGTDYINALGDREPPLDVWDRGRLAAVAARTQRPELRSDQVTLVANTPPTAVDLDAATKLAIGVIPAQSLVGLPGLDDLSLFDPNVRLSLGRTAVNRDLRDSVTTPAEHALFPAYHNGLTVLTHGLEVVDREIRLDGISVVNGCQSLLTLYENQQALTPDLVLTVKAIQVDTTSSLPEKITFRTNNQNSVDIRDQRSRDPIQRDLQAQVGNKFGASFGYAIRRGEQVAAAEILLNESAAQWIMAVYLGEPWAAVRKLRLFDTDYHRIFNRSIDADKLYLIYVLATAVGTGRGRLRADLASSFSSIRLTLAYLLAEVLRETEQGRALLDSPERFLPDLRSEVEDALSTIAQEVAVSTNTFVENEEAEAEAEGKIYDPKVAFKGRTGVQRIEQEVLRLHRRLAKSDPTYFFLIDPVR